MSQDFFVSVLLDQSLQKPLDYKVPLELIPSLQIGARVEVPLKSKLVHATVLEIKKFSRFSQVKSMTRILEATPQLSDVQWKLAHWMAKYYVAPLQRVLRCFIPSHARNQTKEKSQVFLQLDKSHEEIALCIEYLKKSHPKHSHILEIMLGFPRGVFLTELTKHEVSLSSVETLVKKKYLKKELKVLAEDLLSEEDFFRVKEKTLNPEQSACFTSIAADVEASKYACHLIYGVTGSGKTEIYLQAIQKALDLGKSAIMLVPEIALTTQTIERFRARFDQKIAILHHRKSEGEKNSAWEDLRNHKIQIVIGARSAIFAPIQNLGLIIVDEEHDSSYKQSDETPCYHGRDTAVMRGYFENCIVVLASASPSIESRFNAEIGKYKFHILKSRATNAHLPKVHVMSMKNIWEKNSGFTHFSSELISAMKKRIEKGEQTLLLLNKRGYHRMQLCRVCSKSVKCPHCDLSLTFHKQAAHLKCHICDYTSPPAKNCPHCNEEHSLEFKGFGTEHVERSLHAVLPGVRSLRMDRDTTGKKNSHEELFQQFRSHKADVLIGTQMIAKGFHFPSVSLVGILNLDGSLMIPDFRAAENAFQLLIQTAGRAGRAEIPGEVFLQTHMPDHPIIELAKEQNYDAFYEQTIVERKMFGYPPFCHLIKISFSNKEEQEAEKMAESARVFLLGKLPSDCEIFPVTKAGHPKVKDEFRFQILIKLKKVLSIAEILMPLSKKGIKIDVDPMSTFF